MQTANKASRSAVFYVIVALLSLTSTMDGANLSLCRSNSTDYVLALNSTGEAVCCRERICPPGHYAEPCSSDNPESASCRPCSPGTFQSKYNLLGIKCIKKKLCDGSCTKYKHGGTSTEDAECKCKQGCYWDEDSFSCKENKMCPPGYGIDDKGGCTECYPGTFSDKYDSLEKCRPHTKCYMFNRCIRIPGNATHDNMCCDLPKAGIEFSSPKEQEGIILLVQVCILSVVCIVQAISSILQVEKLMKSTENIKGSIDLCAKAAKFRRGAAEDYTPIPDSDCKCENTCPKGISAPGEINRHYKSEVKGSVKIPCSKTGTNTPPLSDPNEVTDLKAPCSKTGTNILPWTDPREAAEEPRVLQGEEANDIKNFILPTEDGVKLPVTKTIDEPLQCTSVIPMSIPESLTENLLQFKFVDMFGFEKDSFEVYVCSKQFGKYTEPEVKKLIKDLVKGHGLDCDCDVIVSDSPKRLSFMCGKKPPSPGAKIVMEGNDEKQFGSLGGYFRTSEEDSPVYVITCEHVANKGVKVHVIQSCDAGTEDTYTEVHKGTCIWAIKTGSTPSRFVDIAAIEVRNLGWRPGIKKGSKYSVFSDNIQRAKGQEVYKYGAQTGLTYGKVKRCDFVIRGKDDKSSFQGVVLVEGKSGDFCAGGDSGSFVHLKATNEPLAMVLGDFNNGKESSTYACYPLKSSLEELGKVSNTEWILEAEAHLQCRPPVQEQGGYADVC